MNSAGVMLAQTSPPCCALRHQRASTHSVTPNCPRLPAHHSARAGRLGPNSATATVASSSMEMGSVAMKVWRTGWRRSSAQASAWVQPRHTVAAASSTNTSAARPPTTSATAPAGSPISGTARCQASARPPRPITVAYQPGKKNFSFGAAPLI